MSCRSVAETYLRRPLAQSSPFAAEYNGRDSNPAIPATQSKESEKRKLTLVSILWFCLSFRLLRQPRLRGHSGHLLSRRHSQHESHRSPAGTRGRDELRPTVREA